MIWPQIEMMMSHSILWQIFKTYNLFSLKYIYNVKEFLKKEQTLE